MHKHELIQSLRPVSRDVSKETLVDFTFKICEAINTPRSLTVWLLLESKEFKQLVSLEIDPSNYVKAHAFADDYLVTKMLSKYPSFSHEELDPEKTALSSFIEYENLCHETNKRFRQFRRDPSLWDPLMRKIFYNAKRKISSVLGKPNIARISDSFGWGPGANTSSKGSHTSAYVKFKSRLDVTSNCLVLGQCCINSNPAWANCQSQTDEFPSVGVSILKEAFNVVQGNEIVFVPKNAKTHRIIAKEPTVNSYLQKGFGNEIRELMRWNCGINLRDQTANQKLARHGSLYNDLATIDLSGASDTISFELVRFLLPESWFSLLDSIRSKKGYLRKEERWIYYEKFSSMGNACTFELESLIFWAICKSCLEEVNQGQVLSVYGDDLIISSEASELVVNAIEYAGFKVNSSKSYFDGNFRESCGKDYFKGTDVRPIFLKEEISNAESLFKLANSVRRYSHRRNFNYGCDIRFRTAWLCLYDRCPRALRYQIPEGFGDSGFVSNWDEARPSLRRPTLKKWAGWEGYVYKGLIRLPLKKVMRDRHGGYTAVLSVIGSEEPLLGHHDLRKATYPKETRIHTHEWYEIGPWC